MTTKIELSCPPEQIAETRRVLAASRQFDYGERVPVLPGVSERYQLDRRGVELGAYYESPEAQVYHQLQNFKWRAEHILTDVIWDAGVTVAPDFGHVVPAAFFDEAQIVFTGSDTPRIVPCLTDPKGIDALRVPEPAGRLGRKYIDWYLKMRDIVKDYELTVNGKAVPIDVGVGGLGGGIMLACVDLAGENVFVWMVECPDKVHLLLEKICRAKLSFWKWACQVSGHDLPCRGGSGDAAEMLSPKAFREFYIPYYNKTHLNCGQRRNLHMCGNIMHLLDVLRDELKITELNGFGSLVDRRTIATALGGRVRLKGNVDPVLLQKGHSDDIRKDVFDALETMAPAGGYTLCDGYSLVPGTPVENVNLMTECAREYGKPPKRTPSY